MHPDILIFNAFLSEWTEKISLACMFVRQHNRLCDVHLNAVCMHSHRHACDTPVCFAVRPPDSYVSRALIFSVQAAEVHWRVPMKTHTVSVCLCPCVTTLVEVMASLNVFYAFIHWSVPEKKSCFLFVCLFFAFYI